jgi:succinate dehydrogenase / fumarate reductase, flavoprotein subunit
LADGYFVLPYTITHWLAGEKAGITPTDHAEFKRTEAEVSERINKLLAIKGKKTPNEFHHAAGKVMWEYVGMARTKQSCEIAIGKMRELRDEFWKNVTVPGTGGYLNNALERAGRVADFLEFGELLARDALTREESCGGHFRSEYQYDDGEAKRDDTHFMHVAAWEYKGPDAEPVRQTEPLTYEVVHPSVRSYK